MCCRRQGHRVRRRVVAIGRLQRNRVHAQNVIFRFDDGDFVGPPAVQAAREKAWRGDPSLEKARFDLTGIVVLTTDLRTAKAPYTYEWKGAQGTRTFTIEGRCILVLDVAFGRFRMIREHLRRFPGA